MPNEDKQFDTLPPAIIDALRDLDGPAVLPDHQRDADVLSGARQYLATAGLSRKRRNLRLFFAGSTGGAIAAAAMIAFVLFIGNPAQEKSPSADLPSVAMNNEKARPARGGDLDANGSVDILDAYALAKHVEAGGSAKAYDYNSDGRIDQQDIDWIASKAVTLNPGEQG